MKNLNRKQKMFNTMIVKHREDFVITGVNNWKFYISKNPDLFFECYNVINQEVHGAFSVHISKNLKYAVKVAENYDLENNIMNPIIN